MDNYPIEYSIMYFARDLQEKFSETIGSNLILILVGARQTGKTTFLKKTYNEIQGYDSKSFINLENPELLALLNEHPDNLFKITNITSEKKQVIFIDEIQYLSNPTNFLKYLYDEYKDKLKLIVSGSSSFYMDHKFKDSLMGRKKIFYLYGLSFNEFLLFKNEQEIIINIKQNKKIGIIHKKKLEQLFSEYITYGSYPSIVLEPNYDKKRELLSEIALDYIKKDIYEANIQDQEKYFKILKILAQQIGCLVNNNELANTMRLSATTVEKYLYVMQKCYQVALVKPFYKNIRKELTKMPKIYFFDLGLRNFLYNDFKNIELRTDKGSFFENVVFREMLLKHGIDNIRYWRTQDKHEVDFIINEQLAYEVKFKNTMSENKYHLFKSTYPEIKFSFLTFENIMEFILF